MSDDFQTLWEKELEADDLTAEKFTSLIQQYINHSFPELIVEHSSLLQLELVVDSDNQNQGMQISMNLHNPWKACSNHAGQRRAVLSSMLEGLAQTAKELSSENIQVEASLDNVIPLVRSKAFITALEEQDFEPIWKPYLDDLVIVYGVDVAHRIMVLSRENREEFDVSDQELFDTAFSNFKELVGAQAGLKTIAPGFFQLVCGGDHESGLVLSIPFMEIVAERVEGKLVVSIPQRNVVFATGDKSAEHIAQLRQITTEFFNESNSGISDKLFVFEFGKFEIVQ